MTHPEIPLRTGNFFLGEKNTLKKWPPGKKDEKNLYLTQLPCPLKSNGAPLVLVII